MCFTVSGHWQVPHVQAHKSLLLHVNKDDKLTSFTADSEMYIFSFSTLVLCTCTKNGLLNCIYSLQTLSDSSQISFVRFFSDQLCQIFLRSAFCNLPSLCTQHFNYNNDNISSEKYIMLQSAIWYYILVAMCPFIKPQPASMSTANTNSIVK